MSRAKRPLRFTDINQACLAKMTGRRLQEEVLNLSENFNAEAIFYAFTNLHT